MADEQAMPSGPSLRISLVLGWNTPTPLTLTWIWRSRVPLSSCAGRPVSCTAWPTAASSRIARRRGIVVRRATWDHLRRRGSVSGKRRGAHPAGRGSARVHAGGAVQLPVAGLLRPVRCRGAGQQPVGRRLRVRATGHRGLAKMQLRVTMALTIMLTMAVGRIRAGQPENLRSLVNPPDRRPLAGRQEKPNPHRLLSETGLSRSVRRDADEASFHLADPTRHTRHSGHSHPGEDQRRRQRPRRVLSGMTARSTEHETATAQLHLAIDCKLDPWKGGRGG